MSAAIVKPGRFAPVSVAAGEMVPVSITIDAGERFRMSVPLGAFCQREGRTGFVPTVDIVGLAAVVLGIGVGAKFVRAVVPVLRVLAEKTAPPSG